MLNTKNLLNSMFGFIEGALREGSASLGYLNNRTVVLLNQVQGEINGNPAAAISFFVVTNAIFFTLANKLASAVNHHLFKQDGKTNLKKMTVTVLVVGGTVFSLNTLLAKVINLPLNPLIMAALATAVVVGKQILDHSKTSSAISLQNKKQVRGDLKKEQCENNVLRAKLAAAEKRLGEELDLKNEILTKLESTKQNALENQERNTELTLRINSIKQQVAKAESAILEKEKHLRTILKNKTKLEKALHQAEEKNNLLAQAKSECEGKYEKLKKEFKIALESEIALKEKYEALTTEMKNLKKSEIESFRATQKEEAIKSDQLPETPLAKSLEENKEKLARLLAQAQDANNGKNTPFKQRQNFSHSSFKTPTK